MELSRRTNDMAGRTTTALALDDRSPAHARGHVSLVHDVDEDDAPLTRADLERLPAALDVPTAARLLGIGRTMAYELVRTGQWPTPVIRIGLLVKISTEPLLALLGATRTGHDTSAATKAG